MRSARQTWVRLLVRVAQREWNRCEPLHGIFGTFMWSIEVTIEVWHLQLFVHENSFHVVAHVISIASREPGGSSKTSFDWNNCSDKSNKKLYEFFSRRDLILSIAVFRGQMEILEYRTSEIDVDWEMVVSCGSTKKHLVVGHLKNWLTT